MGIDPGYSRTAACAFNCGTLSPAYLFTYLFVYLFYCGMHNSWIYIFPLFLVVVGGWLISVSSCTIQQKNSFWSLPVSPCSLLPRGCLSPRPYGSLICTVSGLCLLWVIRHVFFAGVRSSCLWLDSPFCWIHPVMCGSWSVLFLPSLSWDSGLWLLDCCVYAHKPLRIYLYFSWVSTWRWGFGLTCTFCLGRTCQIFRQSDLFFSCLPIGAESSAWSGSLPT